MTHLITDVSSVVKSVRSWKHRSCYTDITFELSVRNRCHFSIEAGVVAACLFGSLAYSVVFEFGDGAASGGSSMILVPCQGFELHGQDVARFEICLKTVLEPLELSTSAMCTIGHLSIERPLWYSVIFHAYITWPVHRNCAFMRKASMPPI